MRKTSASVNLLSMTQWIPVTDVYQLPTDLHHMLNKWEKFNYFFLSGLAVNTPKLTIWDLHSTKHSYTIPSAEELILVLQISVLSLKCLGQSTHFNPRSNNLQYTQNIWAPTHTLTVPPVLNIQCFFSFNETVLTQNVPQKNLTIKIC